MTCTRLRCSSTRQCMCRTPLIPSLEGVATVEQAANRNCLRVPLLFPFPFWCFLPLARCSSLTHAVNFGRGARVGFLRNMPDKDPPPELAGRTRDGLVQLEHMLIGQPSAKHCLLETISVCRNDGTGSSCGCVRRSGHVAPVYSRLILSFHETAPANGRL